MDMIPLGTAALDDVHSDTATVGGYRLVRLLGSGARADVYLGHPVVESTGDVGPEAIKVFRPHTDRGSIHREIVALETVAGDHIVELRDVSLDPQRQDCLVLQRLHGPSVAHLVENRGSLRAGEVITILVPIITAVARMHELGVAHGAIGATSVLLDGRGAPVLTGFGHAALLDARPARLAGFTEARLDANMAVAEDRHAIELMCRGLLATIPRAPTESSVVRVVEWLDDCAESRTGRWMAELAQAVFAMAPSEPVDLRSAEVRGVGSHTAVSGLHLRPGEDPRNSHAAKSPVGLSLIARLHRAISGVRSGFRWAAVAGIVALVGIAVVTTTTSGEAGKTPSADGNPHVGVSDGAVDGDSHGAAATTGDGAIAGEDPVAAVLALLVARAACLKDLSLLCLDTVDQPGAAALATDREYILNTRSGASDRTTAVNAFVDVGSTAGGASGDGAPDRAIVTERLGDAVLIEITAGTRPASVLVVKGEAGWRIREFFEPPD